MRCDMIANDINYKQNKNGSREAIQFMFIIA